jgi:hypothetical protein
VDESNILIFTLNDCSIQFHWLLWIKPNLTCNWIECLAEFCIHLNHSAIDFVLSIYFLFVAQEVQPNSPADLAGLKSDSDYIIGADSVLHEVGKRYSVQLCTYEGFSLNLFCWRNGHWHIIIKLIDQLELFFV